MDDSEFSTPLVLYPNERDPLGEEVRWAWLAGLFEGEGTISIVQVKHGGSKRYPAVRLRIGSTDRDVIQTCQKIAAVGSVRTYASQLNGRKHKDVHMWAVGRRQDVRYVLGALLPYFHGRRRNKAIEALDVIADLDERRIARQRKMEPHTAPPGHISIKAAAERLGLSYWGARKRVIGGQLPSTRHPNPNTGAMHYWVCEGALPKI